MSAIKPELKGLFASGFPLHNHPFEPAAHEDFGVSVLAFIGPYGTTDSHEFKLTWCTPTWLSRAAATSEKPLLIRAHVVTSSWTPEGLNDVEDVVRAVCAEIEGPDWGTVAARLARSFDWEMTYSYDAKMDAGETYE